MNKTNFHYISVLLDMVYGIELDDEVVEEIGLVGWGLIGNKDTRLYRYTACLDKKNSIKLPCNAISVESATVLYEDWKRTTNYSEQGDQYTSFIEQNIESEKLYSSPYYISGKFIPYEQINDTLYFRKNYGKVNILYKGIYMDEDGLPQLTDKEALALATYLAYCTKFKESLVTNNPQITQQSELLYNKWLKQCDQARVTTLSQNDMDQILDIKNSWDRKSYGISLKVIK